MVGVILLLLGIVPTHGISSSQDQNGRNFVNLGIVSAPIGEEARVPLNLTVNSQTQIGQLTSEVRFNHKWLIFKEIDLSEHLETARTQVDAKVQRDPDGDTSTLIFTISVSENGLAPPSGTVLELVFSVAEDADDTHMLTLDMEAEALTSGGSPQPIEDLEVYGGGITVLGPATLFGCFFYMH